MVDTEQGPSLFVPGTATDVPLCDCTIKHRWGFVWLLNQERAFATWHRLRQVGKRLVRNDVFFLFQ